MEEVSWTAYLENLRKNADDNLRKWNEGEYEDEYQALKKAEHSLKMYQAAAAHYAAVNPQGIHELDPGYMGSRNT